MVILSLYGLNAVCDFDGFLDDWTILRRFILWHWANRMSDLLFLPPLPIFFISTPIHMYSPPFSSLSIAAFCFYFG